MHVDVKKLAKFETPGRRIDGNRRKLNSGPGFEHVYACVDDASRVAFLEVREREDRLGAAAFASSA